MFETNDQAELQSTSQLEEGTRRWAYVAQTSNREWFFVTYEMSDSEITVRQQFMIPMAQYLLQFASRNDPKSFIHEVQLVSPPWLNKKGAWMMEPVRAIQRSGERFCYELLDGRIYPADLASHPRKTLWAKDEQFR